MSAAPDAAAERQARILGLARDAGTVEVDGLALALGVTPQTIRRDLNQLADRALLSRTHGGARAVSGVANLDREARRGVAAAAKAAIGRAAAALVPDGASLLLNIGTTTEAVARALVDHRDLMVVTNNLHVVDILAGRPSIQVIAAGGRVRAADRAVVGALATDFIRGFRVDLAMIGASGIAADGSLLDYDADEVHVARTMLACARTAILVADGGKVGRPAPVRIAGLDAIDRLVTDRLDDPALLAACDAAGVAVSQTGQANLDRPAGPA